MCQYHIALVFLLTLYGRVHAEEQKSPDIPRGCPFSEAVRQVDTFVDGRIDGFGTVTIQALNTMAEASANATKPGIPIGQQMSKEDSAQFQGARHMLITVQSLVYHLSAFKRDVHVIAETYQVSKYADLYEVSYESLGQYDPRRFYYMVLDLIRKAQPLAMQQGIIDHGVKCDPEAGLFFEEEFNRGQLSKAGINPAHIVKLIEDIQRLRSLYQVVWVAFDQGSDEVANTTWNGDDTSNTPALLEPAISHLPSSGQVMWKTVMPFISEQMPTEKDFEVQFQIKYKNAVEKEYPGKSR
jgi:hypothetical protein